jgi:hypothetical protein
MIVVRVELHSAVSGQVQELARAIIANDGTGTPETGHYIATTLRGRSAKQLSRLQPQRSAHVRDWPRQRLHVWNLVVEALIRMGYSRHSGPGSLAE